MGLLIWVHKHYMCKSLKSCLLSDIGYVSVSLKKCKKLSINEDMDLQVETSAIITVQNSANLMHQAELIKVPMNMSITSDQVTNTPDSYNEMN